MYKLCKTEQSAKRQREIENVLLDMLRTRRFEDLTITELCEYMKMPRKAFYRYFDSKEDALDALIDHTLGEYTGFIKAPEDPANRRLQSEIEEYFYFWRDKKELLNALYRNGLIGLLIDKSVGFPVNDRVNIDKFQPDRDVFTKGIVLQFAFSGLIFVMLDWYRNGFKVPVPEISSAVCSVLTKPLFPNLGDLGIKV